MATRKREQRIQLLGLAFLLVGIAGWNIYLTTQLRAVRGAVTVLRAELNLPPETASSTPPETEPATEAGIPSAVAFTALSSPLLTPQADISVTLTNVAKRSDGSIVLSITASTEKAEAYTALEPQALFSLIKGEERIYPSAVSQGFDSLAPQSSVSGTVTFEPDSFSDTVILKIDGKDGSRYYEFNFATKTYQEASLG